MTISSRKAWSFSNNTAQPLMKSTQPKSSVSISKRSKEDVQHSEARCKQKKQGREFSPKSKSKPSPRFLPPRLFVPKSDLPCLLQQELRRDDFSTFSSSEVILR